MTETHPEKRLIDYARVSTVGQTLDSQLEQLRAAGCASRNIYREKVTGAHADRRELLRMLKALVPGDVVTALAPEQRKEAIHRRARGLPCKSWRTATPWAYPPFAA